MVIVGSRRVLIPEQTPRLVELIESIRSRIVGGEAPTRHHAMSTELIQSCRFPVPGKWGGFLSLALISYFVWHGVWSWTQLLETGPGSWEMLALIFLLFVTWVREDILCLLNERLNIYSDRVERVAPNGNITARVWLDESCTFDKIPWIQSVRLESETSRIVIPESMAILPMLKNLVESRQVADWMKQSLSIQYEFQRSLSE